MFYINMPNYIFYKCINKIKKIDWKEFYAILHALYINDNK